MFQTYFFFLFKAPSFYWEVELCSLGNANDQDPGPCISVGFAPWTDQLASGWINPVGSCLLHRYLTLKVLLGMLLQLLRAERSRDFSLHNDCKNLSRFRECRER